MKILLQRIKKTGASTSRTAVVSLFAFVILSAPLFALFRPLSHQSRSLSFADRVAAQRAIEQVYWQHRIWPKENSGSKPALDEVMSKSEIEKKVRDYLLNSQLLEQYWQRPITSAQLQEELDRIAQHTKQPEVLREIFAALDNDPSLIAECLARPTLAQRLISDLYAHDSRFHGELKQRAESALATKDRVEDMKKADATYSEVEWIKTNDLDLVPDDRSNSLKLKESDWDQHVEQLAAAFGTSKAKLPVGRLSKLKETDAAYYATAVIGKSKDKLKVATISWQKQSFDSWRATATKQLPVITMAMAVPLPSDYTIPSIDAPILSAPSCTDDAWNATSTTNSPDARYSHSAIWTGTEMIVWGGNGATAFSNTGGRYNPSTDSWTATSTTNAPSGRFRHSAVWTGSQMIVWGGEDGSGGPLNTGGRYNPFTDTWSATNTSGAPAARRLHTAIWTGSEMIVWGGTDNFLNAVNSGGRYNPTSDTWTTTTTTNAPTARSGHTAVWTGTQMVVWGGTDGSSYFNTGGKYSPASDSWTTVTTTNSPAVRAHHAAVWTGSEMIVWGGGATSNTVYGDGARYNPTADSWTATTNTGAPPARDFHTAVWTGSEMIVWGGYDGGSPINSGGRYAPGTDTWTSVSATNAPEGRDLHTAVWTGNKMIVWGGINASGNFVNTGGRYCAAPCTDDSWTAMSTTNAPSTRSFAASVWTGSELIVWGGTNDGSGFADLNTGGRYNPTTDSWTATTTTSAPLARCFHRGVWTGTEMIVWGGADNNFTAFNTGGRYNPLTDTWTATSTTGAPSARYYFAAVWTGSQMVVWGGNAAGVYTNTGGKYSPSTNTWTATTTTNAPTARFRPSGIWTGTEMIVWGGWDQTNHINFNSGGRYNPSADSWTATTTTNAPAGRFDHSAVWTGTEMIVWGGLSDNNGFSFNDLQTGGKYNPTTDSWTATTTTNAPFARDRHTAIWTGNQMIVWGGAGGSFSNGGSRYTPGTDTWTTITTTNAPTARNQHVGIWTGEQMIIWSGWNGSVALNTGGKYCVQPPVAPSPTPTPTPSATFTPTPTPTPSATFTPTPTATLRLHQQRPSPRRPLLHQQLHLLRHRPLHLRLLPRLLYSDPDSYIHAHTYANPHTDTYADSNPNTGVASTIYLTESKFSHSSHLFSAASQRRCCCRSNTEGYGGAFEWD